MTAPISFEEVEAIVLERNLIGMNIHYRPETKTWCVWTRNRNSDGWSISGQHEDLASAIRGVTGPPEDDDWKDLI